jgi:hypothetical protein
MDVREGAAAPEIPRSRERSERAEKDREYHGEGI